MLQLRLIPERNKQEKALPSIQKKLPKKGKIEGPILQMYTLFFYVSPDQFAYVVFLINLIDVTTSPEQWLIAKINPIHKKGSKNEIDAPICRTVGVHKQSLVH